MIVPGTEQEVQAMKEELGLKFDVKAVPDLSIHEQFGLVAKDAQGNPAPLRGYGIVRNGKITEVEANDYAGVNSLKIVKKAS